MPAESLADRLDRQIAEDGPMPVSAYVDAALYDAHAGFYATGGRAGRGGDFLTAPEVGPLFGAVVARAVDTWWEAAGRPDAFVVEEWGAGPGTLARAVVAAEPVALTAGALQWVAVERAAAQRALHLEHPQLASVGPDRATSAVDVVIANELLDNLAFDIAERTSTGWRSVRIGSRDASGRFTELPGEALERVETLSGAAEAAVGVVVPIQTEGRRWVEAATARADRVVVLDYGADTGVLATRDGGWLRTHRGHDGGADWLAEPGSCDITTDVAFDQLPAPARRRTQADWLADHGIEALVEEGRRIWEASAAVGDLAALKARSRIREAEALTDPDGMGGFHVLEWVHATGK